MAIDIYGATWCGDCRQAKNTLDKLGVAYTWHNIEEEEGVADRAVAISAVAPRGDTPSLSDGECRVAPTMSTM